MFTCLVFSYTLSHHKVPFNSFIHTVSLRRIKANDNIQEKRDKKKIGNFGVMRLLTHNLLQCNRKGCTGGFPLKVNASSTELQESEFNPDFIRAMLSKLEYSALVETAQSLDVNLLPPCFDITTDLQDENFLKAVHDTISDFHVLEGSLVCPSCAREFPITKGIPNMLLTPDEV